MIQLNHVNNVNCLSIPPFYLSPPTYKEIGTSRCGSSGVIQFNHVNCVNCLTISIIQLNISRQNLIGETMKRTKWKYNGETIHMIQVIQLNQTSHPIHVGP